MTKKEIVKTISEEIGLTQLKTKEIVQKTFDAIVETLVTDGRIELRNFGVFEVKKRAARKARNPRTGDKVDVPEKFVVTFKPGKEMEERVRQLELENARRIAAENAARQNAAGSGTENPVMDGSQSNNGPMSNGAGPNSQANGTQQDLNPNLGSNPASEASSGFGNSADSRNPRFGN